MSWPIQRRGGAETLAAQAAMQEKALAQNASQFGLTLNEKEEAREDAGTAGLISAGMKGLSMIPNYLMNRTDSKGNVIEQSPLSKASDYFKRTLGGEIPGGEAGAVAGGLDYNSPEGAFAMPASMPTEPTAAIGSNAGTGGIQSYNMMSDNLGAAPKPDASMLMSGPTVKGGSPDFGGQAKAAEPTQIQPIGTPVDGMAMSGLSKNAYEDTDLTTSTNAAEPGLTLGGQGAGAEGGAIDIPNYEAPNFAPYEAPTFAPFQADPYTPGTYDPFKAPATNNDWRSWEKQAWKEGVNLAKASNAERQAYMNNANKKVYDKALSDYTSWKDAQEAARQGEYNTWLTGEKGRYETETAKAEAEAKAAYEAAKKTAEAEAKAAYDKAAKGASTEDKSPWSYNTKRLGGGPESPYYGAQFSPVDNGGSRVPAAFDPSGYFSPPDGGISSTKNFSPVSTKKPGAYEVLSNFTRDAGPAYSSPGSFKAEAFNYEPPGSYGSSRGGYEAFNYQPADFEPVNYEPAPASYESPYRYEAFNYEPAPSYEYEPFNYEAGSGGSGTIVCTELNRRGYLSAEILASDSKYRQDAIPFHAYVGYLTLFGPVVALMKRSRIFANIVRPFGVATAKEMASRVNPEIKGTQMGMVLLKLGVPLCSIVGKVALGAVTTAVQHTEVQHG